MKGNRLLQGAGKGAIFVLRAPIALPVSAITKLWSQACIDINAAGASFIVHGAIAAVAGLFFLLTSKNKREVRFARMVDITQELSNGGGRKDDDRKGNRARRQKLLQDIMGGNLPIWVEFPDWEKAPFLQALLSAAWPGIDNAVSDLLRKLITDSLDSIKGYGTVELSALEFGRRPVTIAGVKVEPWFSNTQEIESIALSLHLKWAGTPTLEVSFSPTGLSSLRVGAAVRYLHFSGLFRLELSGIKRTAPFFNKWSISMMNTPKPTLDFDLRFLGFVGNALISSVDSFIPAFKDFLLSTALKPITYPKTVGDTIGDDTDSTSDRVARPLGVLEIEVVAGELAQRTGFMGRKRVLHPRISLLLPPVTTPSQWEDERIKQAATAGAFTQVAENSGSAPLWNSQRFQLVVTSRSQSLQVILSHKRSFVGANAQMEPMLWDKPLGSAKIPLDDIIPEYFVTPPATPPADHDKHENATSDSEATSINTGVISDDSAFSDNNRTSTSVNGITEEDAAKTLDAVAEKLANVIDCPAGPVELKDCWIEVNPTDHKAMSAIVDEATGEKARDSIFYGTEQDEHVSHFGTSIKDKLVEALQGQMLDPAGERAYDDWDWGNLLQNDKDNIHLKLRWRPLKADSGIKKVTSFKLDFTEAELEEVHEPLGAVCKICMHSIRSDNGQNNGAKDESLGPLRYLYQNVTIHPVPKPLLESPQKGRLEAAMARRHALDQIGIVTGVLAVFVERSKLHFVKNSPTPTMGV